MKITKYNGKIALYKTNRIAKYNNSIVVGYDNVTGSPYAETNYYFLVKHKFVNISTTKVGIRVPIITGPVVNAFSGGYNIDNRAYPINSCDINIWNTATVGDNPPWGSSNYMAMVSSVWSISSTSTYVEFSTTDSTAKSNLNTTDYFWIGILLRDTRGSFYRGVLTYDTTKTNNCQLRRYTSYVKDHDLGISIIDISA